ncbi:MAG: tetratricopeptide repeat protein [Bacteroidota bacterium]
MLRRFCALLLAVLALTMVRAADPPEDLQLANAAYRSGKYAEAITGYRSLLSAGYRSADLYYNLGSSYLKNRELGPAILYLERARLLAPSDPDIQHNLELARQQLTDDISEVPSFFLSRWWEQWALAASATFWSVLGLLLVWLGLAGLGLWQIGRERAWRKKGFLWGLPLLLLGIVPLLLGFSRVQMIEDSPFAIIQAAKTTLYTAPDTASEALFPLHEGTKVALLDRIGEWYKVRLLNGDQGWLSREHLLQI